MNLGTTLRMTFDAALGSTAHCQIQLYCNFRVPPDAPDRFLQLQSMLVVIHCLQGPTPVLGWQHANLPVQNLTAIRLSTVLERLRHRPSRHLPADTGKGAACHPDTETSRTTDTPECPGLGRPPSCAVHPAGLEKNLQAIRDHRCTPAPCHGPIQLPLSASYGTIRPLEFEHPLSSIQMYPCRYHG